MVTASIYSRAVRITKTERRGGRNHSTTQTLTPTQILLRKAAEEKEEAARRAELTEQERRAENALRDIPEPYDAGDAGWDEYEDDVLRGRTAADISHAGEALTDDAVQEAQEDLLEGLRFVHRKLYGGRRDHRTRGDRTKIMFDKFASQMEFMVDAYLQWSLDTADKGFSALFEYPEDTIVKETLPVYVVDLFSSYYDNVAVTGADEFVASAFVRQGLIPVSPTVATVAITVRTLQVFRRVQLRCPRLGVQPFVRALCDLHGVAPRSYLATQFSVAFDILLAILSAVDMRVQRALGRDTPNWRLQNACPSCLYKLEGEEEIPLPFLATIDGNNSLKRFWRRRREEEVEGVFVPGASKERIDTRTAPGDYYISRAEVDKWSKEGLDDLMREFVPGSEVDDEGAGCTERWQNMKEDATARAYRMYDETGIFPALCRHGFVLVIVDMVKSGELAKYGFAVTAHLLRVLGELGLGYDIGCKFGKMVLMHPALAQLAAGNNFKALVGAFHGHAHNRRCQLGNLATYVPGMGLEDLEGCESFFSKSNALAATTRYASVFHRQQAITTYLKHADAADAYQGLSILLANKYRRALKIKGTEALLRETMATMGVASRSVFETWLEKEKAYLALLSKEPAQETLEMEYYQRLVNLQDYEERVKIITRVGLPMMPVETDATYTAAASQTRRIETQRRHAIEVRDKALAVVEDLEIRLDIARRWEDDGDNWIRVAKMAKNRTYQRAIDALEGLVVARMFELSKVNMSDTGYKLRKHIAKALQTRSKGVKSALDRYNTAAAAMTPPRTQLSWDQIVDYAFLADFDLLREGREDIRGELWAQPAGRVAMDQHFKLLRADEEIVRLNLEIPRLVTHMADEDAFLIYQERCLAREGNPALAHQVGVHRMERGRFNALHMERLVKLSKEPGFTASLTPGVSINTDRRVPEEEDIEMANVGAPETAPPPQELEADVDPDAEVDVEHLADAFEHIMRISHDTTTA
ncbi:hypothetical protein C8F04DRAFT_1276622 [Mycena alexandri]|uniref:Uncharacterized protein n=1 Tax=Mycena alexandri TaxID=1745969 RepID=A0AAD6S1E8_9AGAR|nr:hypothetical protein C8F04DRAFT_1276622 [Mycena alexandri]